MSEYPKDHYTSDIKPLADTKVLGYRSLGVYAYVEGNEDVVIVYYIYKSNAWVLAGTQVLVNVKEWWYRMGPVPENLSILYGGKNSVSELV